MTPTAHYFAFGSNMSSRRLQARVPSATPVGRARLEGWRLLCNKSGVDGSAKANIELVEGAVTWGVLFLLPRVSLAQLDAVEGGYRRIEATVLDDADRPLIAHTYTSRRVTHDRRPFDWYRDLMLEGAREHGLPGEHVAWLESLAVR